MSLNDLRKQIDKIDDQLVKLLNQRFKVSYQVGEHKKAHDLDVHNFSREHEILSALSEKLEEPMCKEYIYNIYSEILSASRAVQNPTNVGFFGLKQSYSHLAAIKYFGKACHYSDNQTINDVFLEVEKGNIDFGVVPLENSTEGIVNHTFDLMMEKDVKIYAEVFLNIHHNFISQDVNIKTIEKVYSHSQALAQTRNWLEQNLLNIEVIAVDSTTKAAELASENIHTAAIASVPAALKYSLNILASNIEDKANNVTKFLVISKQDPQKGKKNKTSIMFSIKDSLGALYAMLLPFRSAGINLTKIESRPTKKRIWEYVFFVDFLGHKDDLEVRKALNELENQCLFMKILGSYPID
ncbi:MAG: prephenate dehydratase [bacterium]|nr:prephenate dehydratase [bacterium]